MSPLDDLVSIFAAISTNQESRNLLVLDRDISVHLNYLTNNKFSAFTTATHISRIVWIEDVANIQDGSPDSVVFLINLLSDENIHKLNQLSTLLPQMKQNVHLIVAHPSLDTSLQRYLSIKGLLGDLTSYHVWKSLLYFKFDDILSLEYPNAAFKDIYLDDSPVPLQLLAKTLLVEYIDSNYNLRITNVYLKGRMSARVWNIYEKLKAEHLQSLSDTQRKVINDIDDTLFMDVHSFYNNSVDFICLDRSNDLIAALSSQLSYSGLLNETFNVETQLKPITFEGKLINLNDPSDQIFPLIKDLNFSHVGPILNQQAKHLQTEFSKRNDLKDIGEMKNFVGELSNLKKMQENVTKHTNLGEFIISKFRGWNENTGVPELDQLIDPKQESYQSQIIEFQQDILANAANTNTLLNTLIDILNLQESSLFDVFKLLVLISIVKRGIKESEFLPVYNEMVCKFGLENVLPILLNLIKLKIVQFLSGSNQQLPFLSFPTISNLEVSDAQNIHNFSLLAKALNLLPSSESESNTDNNVDADFGYPGYVPIITRLVQSIYSRKFVDSIETIQGSEHAIKYGWNNLSLEHLTGETVQRFLVPERKANIFQSVVPPKVSSLQKNKSTIIICFVGGITMSEVATIRHTLKSNSFTAHKNIRFITTGFLTSDQLIKSLNNAS